MCGMKTSLKLNRGSEPVAYVPDGLHEGTAGGLHFGAEPPDVDVHGAGATQVVVTPDLA